MKVTKYKILFILLVVFLLSACNFQEPAPFTATPKPPKTDTPVPSNTPTPTIPTETPIPSPTMPSDIWLDMNSYELTVEHPVSTEQPEWGSSNELIIPAEGMVGGAVFTVAEVTDDWAPVNAKGVADPKNSITSKGSTRDNPPGSYCVSDYLPKYSPTTVCQILAPEATQVDWITPYFAGPKTEVGIAFTVGACNPAGCTAILRITNIRLIYFSNPE